MPDGIRFLDILITANAVTSYLGFAETKPAHLKTAIAILRGETTIEDVGRPTSPLLQRSGGAGGPPGTAPGLPELVQRWFAGLGGHGDAIIDDEGLDRFLAELDSLESRDQSP